MKRKQIQTINVYISESKVNKPISEYVGEYHLRLVERTLNKMGLNKNDKLTVIDGIIKNLKSQENI